MKRRDDLSLQDLVEVVCDGNVEGDLQARLAEVLRTDPRFERRFEQLEVMRAEAGGADLWEGLERHQELDRLLAEPDWEDPTDVLHTDWEDYVANYGQLLAVADARLATAEDPAAVRAVRDRIAKAEERRIEAAVLAIADTLRPFSDGAARKIFELARRR